MQWLHPNPTAYPMFDTHDGSLKGDSSVVRKFCSLKISSRVKKKKKKEKKENKNKTKKPLTLILTPTPVPNPDSKPKPNSARLANLF